MKSINSLSLVKSIIENVLGTRGLRRPIVFLGVRSSICVRCSILILLRKTERCSFNNNNIIIIIIYLLQLGCYPVAVVILHVNKI